MANKQSANQLALRAAADKKLVRCEVESAEEQPNGGTRIIISGALDIDIDGAIEDGHNRTDVSNLISNMRLQVDIKNGKITQQTWLR